MITWRFTTPAELLTSRLEPFHTAKTQSGHQRQLDRIAWIDTFARVNFGTWDGASQTRSAWTSTYFSSLVVDQIVFAPETED